MATLIVTSDPDSEGSPTSVDGEASRSVVSDSWADILSGAGTHYNDDGTRFNVLIYTRNTSGNWHSNRAGYFIFDTSALTADAVVSAATLSFFCASRHDNLSPAGAVSLVDTTTASNTAIEAADYGRRGSTKQATDLALVDGQITNDITVTNAFTLTSTGLASISLTGITKFAMIITATLSGTSPTWASNLETQVDIPTADETDSGDRFPYLTITYGFAFTPKAIMF